MGGRVFRWGVDVVMCAALVSAIAGAAFVSGLFPLQEEVPLELPWSLTAAWRQPDTESGQHLRTEREKALQDEFHQLEARLDDLETRLLSGLSTVQLWRELAERHQSVSQIACENATEHLKEMATGQKRDRQQRAKVRREKEKAETAAAAP